ncbi:MAG: hypothetical protein HC906_15290 [Bacteroidales bacterium]|nr:hypothetical protein [Bacteroidales bacterium]
MDTILFKFQGGPKTAFLLDMAKNPGNILSLDMIEFYEFKMAGITSINDREAYIIEFDQKENLNYSLFAGKVYLDVKSLAFSGIDFHISERGIAFAGEGLIRKNRHLWIWMLKTVIIM